MKKVSCVAVLFQRAADVWQVAKLCRFNLVLPMLVGIFLIIVPNGQEVLLRMEHEASTQAWFYPVLVVWTLSVWYWARVILSFEFPDWPPRPTAEEQKDPEACKERRLWILKWHQWMPRICGVLAPVVVLWAVALTFHDLKDYFGKWVLLVVITALVAFLFWLFVWKRRRVAGAIKRRFFARPSEEMPLQAAPLRPLSFEYEGRQTQVVFYARFTDLPRSTKILLALSLIVLSLGMFWLFMDRGRALVLAPRLGSATILLLAASGWTCVGALVMYWANQYRVPVFLLAFLWIAFLSPYNDNHPVQTMLAASPSREMFDDRLKNWLAKRAEAIALQPGDMESPVFIVAAEGGGIRAAYWTASVLARIEKAYPGFASHVFAISGVSGGSLGGALFDALLAEEQEHRGRYCIAQTDILTCAQTMLQHDFLAPAFATMLYPDLLQRFLPPLPFSESWDRGVTLEAAWERAWDDIGDHTGKNPFREAFERLWDKENRGPLPSLVLNSASVEDGKRVLLSNFRINQKISTCFQVTSSLPFHAVLDLDEALNLRSCSGPSEGQNPDQKHKTMRLSTAVHNSGRFSYVSPAGMVSPSLHIVDGGYFENSGATAAAELVQAIEAFGATNGRPLPPVVIYIQSSPQAPEVSGTQDQSGIGAMVEFMGTVKSRYLNETLMPVWAILNARSGRGSFAVNWLQLYLEQDDASPKRFFSFSLGGKPNEFPLGWTLSGGTWKKMDGKLENYFSSDVCQSSDPSVLSVYDFFLACWPDKQRVQ